MTITTPTLLGLALADALNPFSIAALIYLLGTARPLKNGLIFTGGTYAAYFLGGLIFLLGWQSLIGILAPLLPWWSLGTLELVSGLALFIGGVWMWKKKRSGANLTPPKDLSGVAVLVFAVASTAADLTSAVPYFAAINVLLLDPELSWAARPTWVAIYCLIYCTPLLLMLVSQSMFGGRAEAIFARVREGVDWALAKLMAPATITASLILVADGARRIVLGP